MQHSSLAGKEHRQQQDRDFEDCSHERVACLQGSFWIGRRTAQQQRKRGVRACSALIRRLNLPEGNAHLRNPMLLPVYMECLAAERTILFATDRRTSSGTAKRLALTGSRSQGVVMAGPKCPNSDRADQ